ncbi:alpha/beta fold hydrolase [Piscinibacter sp. HJYY11]|uniref:alpha/beta fold hydrolase n=1 Tax=Piscinibacter sp. HJYY11 TaxID=2801333 RepID=UPI00191E8E0D|nr:alpha/beta fold hydrolase [Piscinibacter sp. HJYY11]MBL0728501.1 twin-arginine translocation pathway signal [Piscinibacter sp. HJYY11]
MNIIRRGLLLAMVASSAWLAACTHAPERSAAAHPPIVFVHGNGDTAALWTTTLWRFESNGWPRDRLHAIDLPYPLARDTDSKPQEGRTSTTEHMQYLSAEVEKVLKATGASQVVLVGNSRGGNAIRNYIANGGGAAKVSHAILGGTPNHGVRADLDNNPGNEFNGAGPFLSGLNQPKGPNGDEVTPGVKWMTVRSDNNDLYAQPDGAFLGARGKPTHVTFDGPALKGAENVVIPGIDHRETSYSPQAFAQAYRFITGKPPATLAVVPEAAVLLDGKVTGRGLNNVQGNFSTNLPLAGATVEVYATDAQTGERRGAAVHRKTVGADGRWGPFTANAQARYEFVITAPGYAVTHIYRSPFPRSSSVVNLRPDRIADADKDAKALVTLVRPRGYFGVPRDQISLDGKSPPAGIPPGVAHVAAARLKVADAAGRTVVGEFNGERIAGIAWPLAENHVVLLELHQ